MRDIGRLSIALALVGLVTIVGLAGLAGLKFSGFLSDSVGERLEIVAKTAATDLETAIDLGLSIDAVANGNAILERARSHDPAISGIAVFDLEGHVLHAVGDIAVSDVHPETHEAFRVVVLRDAEDSWNTEADARIRSGVVVEGSFGQPVAGVVAHYPITEVRAQESAIARALLFDVAWVGLLLVAAIGVAYLLLRARARRDDGTSRSRAHHGRFVVLVLGLLVVALALFGLLIVRDFNTALEPELERRSDLIGTTVQDDVERALELGIPLHGLAGMEPYVETLIDDFPELEYVVVRGRDGTVLHTGGSAPDVVLDDRFWVPPIGNVEIAGSLTTRYDVTVSETLQGAIDVGIDSGSVRSRLEDLALDVVVIILVALLVGYEIVVSVSDRIAGRSRRRSSLLDLRLVLFLFIVAEELSKSFLPQLTLRATDPGATLDPAVAVSLPIVAYLLTLGLASPFAGRLVSSIGERRLLLLGFAVAVASHLGMVLADSVPQITALRGLAGVGYAVATIASLEYLIARQPGRDRARAMTTFVAVVIGGTFAGTALGGILADRLGYQPVFAIGAAVVIAAAVLAWRLPDRAHDALEDDAAVRFGPRDVVAVLRQPRLLALLAGVTVPLNVALAAFLWYLVPLTLTASGESASVVGRTLMLYYLAVLMAGPLLARVDGARVATSLLVGLGALISGLALFAPVASSATLVVSFAVAVIGLGHAAIRGPQLSLAIEIAERRKAAAGRGATLAAMRMLERLGSLAGLLLAALVLAGTDLATTTAMVAVAVTVAAVAYLASVLIARRRLSHA